MKKKRQLSKFQLIVFYDGWCPYCIKFQKIVSKLDLFKLLKFQSIRETSVLEQYGVDFETANKNMHAVNTKGIVVKGFDSIQSVARRIIWLWPTVPFLWLFKIFGLGDSLYTYIADNRKIIPVSKCTDHCELNINQEYTSKNKIEE